MFTSSKAQTSLPTIGFIRTERLTKCYKPLQKLRARSIQATFIPSSSLVSVACLIIILVPASTHDSLVRSALCPPFGKEFLTWLTVCSLCICSMYEYICNFSLLYHLGFEVNYLVLLVPFQIIAYFLLLFDKYVLRSSNAYLAFNQLN